MPENAAFLPPAPALGGTLFGAVLRDTTGLALADTRGAVRLVPATPATDSLGTVIGFAV